MRTLVLLRGAPGCGKSTWIKNQGLENYTVSADSIRLLCGNPVLKPSGEFGISQSNEKMVWDILFCVLERRMQNGDFTVIDACNSKTSEMTRYRDLADEYRYRIYCVDFTAVPIETAKRQNKMRPQYKIVPEEYINRVYSRFETQKIPAGIARVSPDDFASVVYNKPFDLSRYKEVVVVGDVHGCYDKLVEAVPAIEDDVAYVFLGDYIDRGPASAEVVKFLLDIYKKPNVCLLEGNHERHLWDWANGRVSRSKEFEFKTRPQLEHASIDKKDVRQLYRHMRQCSLFKYDKYVYVCTHGGLALPADTRIDFIPSLQMIRGVGKYEDMMECVDSSARGIADVQIFGHRNVSNGPINVADYHYCLEGGVERGGELRTVHIRPGVLWGIRIGEYSYPNPLPEQPDPEPVVSDEAMAVHSLVASMRGNRLIREKKFGHISSFNFTRKAFYDKEWNDLTTKARGLFIDTVNNRVVARGYEKFFNVGENPSVEIGALSHKLKFPLEAYHKENGFLAMASFDPATNQLFTATKSTPEGPMADLFRSMISDDLRARMEEYLRENNVTLLFEAIHPAQDPHIIKYQSSKLVLLDIVENAISFKCHEYNDVLSVAKSLGVCCKYQYIGVPDMDSFLSLYDEYSQTDSPPMEGFVFRDANGFMVKLKTGYYQQWKKLRYVAQETLKTGHFSKTSMLTTPLENYFYAFLRDIYSQKDPAMPGRDYSAMFNIITLRDMFYEKGGMCQ